MVTVGTSMGPPAAFTIRGPRANRAIWHNAPMKSALALLLATSAVVALAGQSGRPAAADVARWKAQAQRVTITRDDWGIAHVHGNTDADAVFGAEFAQAED